MRRLATPLALIATFALPSLASAGPLTFTDVAGPGSGAEHFERVPSARYDMWLQAFTDSQQEPLQVADMGALPAQSRGLPGVVIFDYDNDGDLDIFVTNGPGGDNALLRSDFAQSGNLVFDDVAIAAGVATNAIDASGACFGDTDNDGDNDLFIVAHEDQHRVFENQGDGTFDDVTNSAINDDTSSGTSCSMADVDQDGLLDVIVVHSWDQNFLFECFSPGFSLNQPTELYLNDGDNTFTEVSDVSGLLDLGGIPEGAQGASWSVAMIDYDLDGDVDVMTADDQCAFNPGSEPGGTDRGYNQLWANDGEGNFENVTIAAHLDSPGAWMGLSYADYNADGNMDFFSTNMGDWFPPDFGNTASPTYAVSRWFFGQDDGTFVDSLGDYESTPFAWGTSSEDFDNDGDFDIASLGAIHLIANREASNHGTIFLNDGDGNFDVTTTALGSTSERRSEHGVAAGDLDGDGLVDLVTVSASNVPNDFPYVLYSDIGRFTGSVFDDEAGFWPIMYGDGVNGFVWGGGTLDNGTIAIELNQTQTNNRSIAIDTVGTVGITSEGVVNRSGFGAVVKVRPHQGDEVLKPVVGGSSHVSQDAEILTFGLGTANKARVEILWPGGVRNRLYNVRPGAQIEFPEIPCSFDDMTMSNWQYVQCVAGSVNELFFAGMLTHKQAARVFASALKARAQG